MYMINSVSDEDIPNFLTPHSFIQTLRSTESLISTNERESYIVIGFRGTNEVLDIAVVLFGHIAGPYGPSGNIQKEAGLVCSGFNRNLQYEVYEWMRREIKMLIDTHPTYNIFFTGHSLGGSLSILSAAQLALDFPEKNITCVTFGAPRCTQNEFKMWTRREIPNCSIWNIVHGADPVARVPASWRGYTHAGHLIQLEEDGATAYFQNTGDHIYEGIPSEWNDRRGSITANHIMKVYKEYFETKSFTDPLKYYVDDFLRKSEEINCHQNNTCTSYQPFSKYYDDEI